MRESGEPATRLETGIAALMAMMEPGYLHADTEAAEAMRRLIYAAGLVLLSQDGGVTPEEKSRLDTLLGPGTVPLDFESAPRRRALAGAHARGRRAHRHPAARARACATSRHSRSPTERCRATNRRSSRSSRRTSGSTPRS
jgi:hypothetical protein